MPLEAPLPAPAARVDALNQRYRHDSAISVLSHALSDPQLGRTALVSSFGTESVVLLHMLSVVDRSTPVLFLDTGMLFPETLAYQQELSAHLGLADMRVIAPDRLELFKRDPDGVLHVMDPDACCRLRKVEPLEGALAGFDAWITGRKRFQGGRRVDLPLFEVEGARIKVNPLANWRREDIEEYIVNNRLPRHPLAGQRLPSLGCMPCTTEVEPGEDPRAGRWRGQEKDECGIHFVDGKAVRGPVPAQGAA